MLLAQTFIGATNLLSFSLRLIYVDGAAGILIEPRIANCESSLLL